MWVTKFRDLTKFQKILVFLIPISLIIIIFTAYFFTIIYSAKVEVLIAPKSAELYIDGKKYNNSGVFSVSPGEKEVIIKANGFQEYKQKKKFTKDTTNYIYTWLDPTEENKNYYNEHSEEQDLVETIAQQGTVLEGEKYNNDPIFKITPVRNFKLGFSASASRDEKDFNKITLTIDLMTCRDNQVENLKKVAESYFKQKGINLSKYQVKYTHCDSNQESDPDFKHDSED
jgi:hypothetical protein